MINIAIFYFYNLPFAIFPHKQKKLTTNAAIIILLMQCLADPELLIYKPRLLCLLLNNVNMTDTSVQSHKNNYLLPQQKGSIIDYITMASRHVLSLMAPQQPKKPTTMAIPPTTIRVIPAYCKYSNTGLVARSLKPSSTNTQIPTPTRAHPISYKGQ